MLHHRNTGLSTDCNKSVLPVPSWVKLLQEFLNLTYTCKDDSYSVPHRDRKLSWKWERQETGLGKTHLHSAMITYIVSQ